MYAASLMMEHEGSNRHTSLGKTTVDTFSKSIWADVPVIKQPECLLWF